VSADLDLAGTGTLATTVAILIETERGRAMRRLSGAHGGAAGRLYQFPPEFSPGGPIWPMRPKAPSHVTAPKSRDYIHRYVTLSHRAGSAARCDEVHAPMNTVTRRPT